jgi:two-component sensor histidine kinase
VLSVSLIFHELTTNAAKYGAFSTPEGQVHVRWTLDIVAPERPYLTCEWREENGPAVKLPERKGYGTKLINGTSAQLGGEMELIYAPSGLVAVLKIPV